MLIVTTINDFFKMQNLITQTVPVQRKPEQNHPPWMFNTGTDLWPRTTAGLSVGTDQR